VTGREFTSGPGRDHAQPPLPAPAQRRAHHDLDVAAERQMRQQASSAVWWGR